MPTYEETYTEEAIRNMNNAGLSVPGKEDMTCSKCQLADTCRYAWDPYNTQGDCLADK